MIKKFDENFSRRGTRSLAGDGAEAFVTHDGMVAHLALGADFRPHVQIADASTLVVLASAEQIAVVRVRRRLCVLRKKHTQTVM